jgi:hypothetical protein
MQKLLVLITCFIYITGYSQEHGTGALLDDSIFVNCPRAPALLSRDLINLPSRVSLRNYAPTPGDQGTLSTCAGWALAYSVRTMVAAIQNGWSKPEIDKNVFSPSYIYNQIRTQPGCNSGTSIVQGLELLKNEGVLKFTDFSYNCNLEVKDQYKPLASRYKIKEYRTIAYGNFKNKTIYVKKSLFEKNPVVIAINCPDSFYNAGDVWKPDSIEYLKDYGGHALAVIGYDDEKYGGAFEVINSWGKNWGNNGFTWIKYPDFNHFCVWAAEEIPPEKQEEENTGLSGAISFKLISGEPVKLITKENYFQTEEPLLSGTRFNLTLSNNEPAYVYAIGSDLTFKCQIIFPFNNNINPYLPYKQNNIALPGEGYNFQLDTTLGKTYFLFLYSPVKLDIDSISKNIEYSNGNFYDRIQNVLGEKLVNKKDINLNLESSGEIHFTSQGGNTNMVALLVEIIHINKR